MSREKCNWMFDTLQKQGKLEGKEMDEHQESCPICKEDARKRLKSVNHSYPLETGWEEPKCPFCFSEIIKPVPSFHYFEAGAVDEAGEPVPAGDYQTGYKIMTCPGCDATYSYDPASDSNDDISDVAGNIFQKEKYELTDDEKKLIDTFIYHNYDYDAHSFNSYLANDFDICEDNGPCKLGHLWFVRKRKEGEKPVRESWSAGAMREEIKQVIEILQKTKGAFKSKLVEEAREKLEKIF